MTIPEGQAVFAEALTTALARDLAEHDPGGPIARIAVRWTDLEEPDHLTLHILTEEQLAGLPAEHGWLPLAWPGLDDDLDRTDRVMEVPDVAAAGAPLGPQDDGVTIKLEDDEDEEELPEPTEEDERLGPPAARRAVSLLPAALAGAGVRLTDDFAVRTVRA